MEIFTNWMFWVVLAGIVFIFAIIGFLVESKKKNGKEKQEPVSPIDNGKDALNQNITKAPEGNTLNLDEVKTNSEDNFNTMPEVNVQNMPQQVEEPQSLETEPQPVVQTPVEQVTQPENQPAVEPISEPKTEGQVAQPQNETTSESQNPTVESTEPHNLPDIAEEVTQEAATLFDNEDDSDVWKV